MDNTALGWVLVAMGLFAICGAVFQWSFFMNHRKARFAIRLLGVGGTRIFYCLLGTAVAVLGLLLALGIVKD